MGTYCPIWSYFKFCNTTGYLSLSLSLSLWQVNTAATTTTAETRKNIIHILQTIYDYISNSMVNDFGAMIISIICKEWLTNLHLCCTCAPHLFARRLMKIGKFANTGIRLLGLLSVNNNNNDKMLSFKLIEMEMNIGIQRNVRIYLHAKFCVFRVLGVRVGADRRTL